MEVKTTMRMVAEGLSFAKVAEALAQGMSNISSEDRLEGGALEQFLQKEGLLGEPIVFLANHSFGGRDYRLVEGEEVPFYPEADFGEWAGWRVLTAENCTYIWCSSATSGSTLTAKKQEGGTWAVTLEIPVDESGPYRGCYWHNFVCAMGISEED